jgi:hypothetical protein
MGEHEGQCGTEHRALVRRGMEQCKRGGRARSGEAKCGATSVGGGTGALWCDRDVRGSTTILQPAVTSTDVWA